MTGDEAENENLRAARHYLAALESGQPAEVIASYFHADAIAEEFPNRLFPAGVRRDLPALKEGVERGRKILASQRFEVQSALAEGNRVAMEVAWSARLTCSLGDNLPEGTTLRARIGMFLEFQDSKIIAQRNYDCYDAW